MNGNPYTISNCKESLPSPISENPIYINGKKINVFLNRLTSFFHLFKIVLAPTLKSIDPFLNIYYFRFKTICFIDFAFI